MMIICITELNDSNLKFMYKWIQQIVFYDMNVNVVVLIITGYSFLGFNMNIPNADFGHFFYHL